jgi:hypothetical protein
MDQSALVTFLLPNADYALLLVTVYIVGNHRRIVRYVFHSRILAEWIQFVVMGGSGDRSGAHA